MFGVLLELCLCVHSGVTPLGPVRSQLHLDLETSITQDSTLFLKELETPFLEYCNLGSGVC